MSGSFYEVLGTSADASPEDIRKAYKKRALQTHPDRLPPGATTEEKRAAEEQFRKVNNAYEILIDKKDRKLYDLYGVWPPPEDLPEEPRHDRGHSHRPSHQPTNGRFPDIFNDPFFNNFPSSPFGDPFSRPHRPATFRDPFELFNSMFAEMQRDMYHPMSHHLFNDPFPRSIFDQGHHPFLGPPSLFPIFPQLSAFPDELHRSSARPDRHFSFESSSRGHYEPNFPRGTEWVSEKQLVRTINGVTQSVWKGRDRHGNEHVTYTYPDGREEYTINGVEQPSPKAPIQDAPSSSRNQVSHAVNSQDAAPFIPPDRGNRFSSSSSNSSKTDLGEGSSKKHWWGRRH